MRPGVAGLFGAVVLLVAACGSGGTTAADEAGDLPVTDDVEVAGDEVEVPTELRVIVAPDSEGRLPADVELQCGGSGAFPASALDDIPLVNNTGMEVAMATFLDTGEGDYWPQEGWRLLHEGDDRAIVVHAEPGGEARVSLITLDRVADQWQLVGAQSGSCPLQIPLPAGLNAVDWRIDPAADALTADSTTIELLITERECVSGQAIGDRLLDPEVVITDDAVLIAFAAVAPRGDQTCPGNPEQAFTVELPQALGQRAVIDGLAAIGDLADFLDP